MTSISIVPQFAHLKQCFQALRRPRSNATRLDLPHLARDQHRLPGFVRESLVAMRYLHLLGPLAWPHFPERNLRRNWGQPTVPHATFAAAYLVKLDQQLPHMSDLCQYLVEHPALAWLLGFPRSPAAHCPCAAEVAASLPTQRHFTRMLRQMPNLSLQFLLDETVRLLQAALEPVIPDFGQAISLDTKHIIAWVKENNPKAYVTGRYDKTKQPKADPDCRLGCKRRHNQRASRKEPPPTPWDNPVPAGSISVGEYYWGYASGVVATKVPDWGEFVLAELTQPFDQPDVSYFFPLLADVERRLGFRPKFGAFDAAFDAFYVYEYFYHAAAEGFAAVPFSARGGYQRTFSPDGLPLCQAGLPMPLKYTFHNKTTLVEHDRGRYVCPLRYPQPTAQSCPVNHKQWAKGGCATTMSTSTGARLRYQLDRAGDAYQQVYKQRTANERINSQATELGIERPKIRNGQAIANLNTLIYVLINLRALQRIRAKKASAPPAA